MTSHLTASATPFPAPEPVTWALALAKIEADPTLSDGRRRNVCSAIRKLDDWFSCDLGKTPPNQAHVTRLFRDVAPAELGVSKKRVQNARSDLSFAIAYLGVGRGRRKPLLTSVWQGCWEMLRTKYECGALSGFLHFCDEHGILPKAVDDATSQAYLRWIEEEGRIARPRTVHQTMCRAWNKAAVEIAGWPASLLTVPRYREVYGSRLEQFPLSFQEELEAYLAAQGRDDVLSDLGPARPLKPGTITARRTQLRILASAMVNNGHNIEAITSLAYLADLDHLRDGLRFLLDRNDGKPKAWHYDLARTVLAIARHWLGWDEKQVKPLADLCRRLAPKHTGMNPKVRDRLRPLDDPATLRGVVRFGLDTFDAVLRSDNGSRASALSAQIAVAFEILMFTGLRIGNLASLSLEQHLRWSRPGRRGKLYISVPSDEVKNELALDFELPEAIGDMVRAYLERFQPRFGDDLSHLFPGRDGAKDKDFLSKQLSRRLLATTGVRLHAHAVRHAIAKIVLEAHPAAYEIVSRILGHRSRDTAYRYYSGMEVKAALELYARLVTELRAAEPSPKRRVRS